MAAPDEQQRNKIENISSKEILKRLDELPHEVILQELKDAYSRQWDLKENHERKATSIITTSGILISLLFGFAGFFHANNSVILQNNFAIAFLVGSIAANVLAVLFSIIGFRLKNYQFMYTNIDNSAIKRDLERRKIEIICDLLGDYNASIKHNANQNNSKLKWIKAASWFLFAGIVAIPFLLIFQAITN